MKTLTLTTPHMTGQPVIAAQAELKTGGILKTDLLRGAIDGEFGPATGRGCIRAKYRLGYPESELKPTYGDKLDGFLKGTKPTPLLYRRRAAARAKHAATRPPMRLQALAYLKTKVGQKEQPPNSNRIPFASDWYGVTGPWCAMAVTRAYVEAGSTAFLRTSRYAYCPFLYADAKYGRNGLSLTTDPMPGDVVLYDWTHDGTPDHVGLFERWTGQGGEFVAVEGNTSTSSDSDGGEVMQRTRTRSLVQAFVRVGK